MHRQLQRYNGSQTRKLNRCAKYTPTTRIPYHPVDCRLDELANVEEWSNKNNLIINRSKSQEIIFVDRRRKRSIQHRSPPLPDINHVSWIKILGVRVTVSDNLSVTGHANNVVTSCAQSVQTTQILGAYGTAKIEHNSHDLRRCEAHPCHIIFLDLALLVRNIRSNHLSVLTCEQWRHGRLDRDAVWGGKWGRARYGCIRFWW